MNNCTYIGGRRIKLYLKVDTENASKDLVYLLSIFNIPSPISPTTGGNIIEI